MDSSRLNLLLTVINGAWTISLAAFSIFMIDYLRQQVGLVWRDWWTHLFHGPQSPHVLAVQFAVAVLVSDVGNWIVRAAVWVWRETDPVILPNWLVAVIIAGAVIGTFGIFCKLRMVSIMRYGHGPWLATLLVTLTFVIARAIKG